MPKFDPYKPPMSVKESEQLLKGANDWEASKLGWRAAFGDFLTVAVLLAGFAGVALALWLLSLVIGTTAAGLIGFVGVLIWLGRQE